MGKRGKRLRWLALAGVVLAVAIYLNNASWLAGPLDGGPFLVAHRGLAQGFTKAGLTGATCTAARMTPPEHDYLENTIPSMQAAFASGAEVVELDVHRTTDDRFAVFHDWTVACRTEGQGATGEHTLEELQRLDVGYGYTADGGASWPFRGKGVGMMPSLDQVLARFPDREFFIDVKNNDPAVGALLAERLAALPAEQRRRLAVIGAGRPVEVVRERLDDVRTMSRARLERCLKRYLAVGWTGRVPAACRRSILFVPANATRWMWGWPNRFLRRMDRAGSRVVIIGDYHGEGFSQGLDDPGRLQELPADYSGGIWTDRIDRIGPAWSKLRGSR